MDGAARLALCAEGQPMSRIETIAHVIVWLSAVAVAVSVALAVIFD